VTFPLGVKSQEGGSGKASHLVAAGSDPAAIGLRYENTTVVDETGISL
jgi:hypothetical protein